MRQRCLPCRLYAHRLEQMDRLLCVVRRRRADTQPYYRLAAYRRRYSLPRELRRIDSLPDGDLRRRLQHERLEHVVCVLNIVRPWHADAHAHHGEG